MTKPPESPPAPAANAMWGGRFAAGPDAIMQAINASIGFDQRLYAQDIQGSRAHAAMLAATGILTNKDAEAIGEGLLTVLSEIETGSFVFRTDLEDIHMNVEARLKELIGEPAGRLHTARSRNDQVAVDFRLWVRDQCDAAITGIEALMRAFVAQADAGAGWVMPGFTHLQTAQPITFGHHMMAWFEMLERDHGRLRDCRARLNYSPLGAAALAGTSYPIEREYTAQLLGFTAATRNSLDSVSDRDFAIELAAAASLIMTHLSRFSEELVLWTSSQFDFVDLPDRFCTGSSIMPQKKNPDVPELVRGKTGRVNGHLVLAEGDVNLTFKRYLERPVQLQILDDHIVDIEGRGLDADLLRSHFEAWSPPGSDRAAYAVSHVGYGLNPAARWDSMAMLDKRDFNGTELRAFSGNFLYSTGANETAQRFTEAHFDWPMRHCSIELDGQTVVDAGRVLDLAP